jgi:3-deoxy-7-phosphoheptulonate synthase/chorismate mutase
MSGADPVVGELREEITEVDRGLVGALNRRLEIVRRLHDHKLANGIPLRDPGREQEMLRLLADENGGPLSAEGLESFYRGVLDLTRRELHGG